MATKSLHTRIKDGIATVIKNLGLSGMRGGIENLTIADITNVTYPCVMLSIGEAEDTKSVDTGTIHTTFPVRCYILDDDANLPADEDKYLAWREVLMAPFNRPPRLTNAPLLAEATEVFNLEVQPRDVIMLRGDAENQLPQWRKIMSGFIIRAEASIRRGKTTWST